MKKPNILFILSDDHACQAIGAYGSIVNQTPNLDRIASEGGVFRQSFCCNSLCAPSRASILTGKHSHVNGQLTLGESFDGSQDTYPKLLQQAGYQTALVGKWHLNSEPTGFDYWKILPGQGYYYNPDYITAEGTVRHEGFVTDLTTDFTLDWLQNQRDASRPFAMMCHFKAPHRPWQPAPRYFDLYEDAHIPEPPTLFDDYADRSDVLKQNEMQVSRDFYMDYDLKVLDAGPNADYFPKATPGMLKGGERERMTDAQRAAWDAAYEPRNEVLRRKRLSHDEMTRWALQRYLKDYLRCIAGIDDNVGRLLDWLDESGLAEDTLVVYCSDQGFYLGEHGWYDKRWMFEESMRMPLLMRWPGVVEAGSVYEQMVQNIDYAPTLLEAAGIPVPEEMHGRSMLPVIREGKTIHTHLYYHYFDHGGHGVAKHDGVRNDRYKLIHFYTVPEYNLFDLQEDPHEMRSLHNDPAHAGLLAEMLTLYRQVRLQFQVPEQYGPEPG